MAITPPHCAALWHGEGRGGEGRREGRTGGEGEEGSEAGRQRVGELLTLGLPWE